MFEHVINFGVQGPQRMLPVVQFMELQTKADRGKENKGGPCHSPIIHVLTVIVNISFDLRFFRFSKKSKICPQPYLTVERRTIET